MQYFICALLIAGGLFTIVCSAKNYDWFMLHRKAVTMSRILGRNGTRVFYIILGVALLTMGIVFLIAPPADLAG